MLTIKEVMKRSKEEKEKILLEIQKMGITAGCRKFGIAKSQYYDWLRRDNSFGLEGLEDRRKVNAERLNKQLQKENEMLKRLLAEKELESKMKDELLKKKLALWRKGGK